MDVIEELKSVRLQKNLARFSCRAISDDAAKKMYLFKVLEFSYLLNELLENKVLEEMDIKKLLIFPTDKEIEPLAFYIHNSTEKIIFLETYTSKPEIINEFQQLLNEISKDSRLEYTSCENSIRKSIEINLIRGADQKALEYLLSNELKCILEYSQIYLDLDSKNKHIQKRIKI